MPSERLLVTNGDSASADRSPEDERDLLLRLLEDEGIDSAGDAPVFADLSERPPLSFAQKRLWFLDRLQPGNPFYNVVAAFDLQGTLNVAALRRSLSEIVRRHGALRTRFVVHDGEPEQKIEQELEIPLPVTDLGHEEPADRRGSAERMITAMGREPFVLSEGPLLRVLLLRLDDGQHLLGLCVHHIVFDEWSLGVLQRELQTFYADYLSAEEQGREPARREMPMQYADYTLWQHEWFRGEHFERQRRYWQAQLQGMPQVLELTTDYARPPLARYRGGIAAGAVSPELWGRLRSLGRREGATLFMTLLAAFRTLLLRYSGQTDFGVGVPVANRGTTRSEGMIGYCLNTLVLRTDLSGAPAFSEVLMRVRESALGGFQHQDMPLERLVEEIAPQRDMSHTPLFQVMFALLSDIAPSMELPGLNVNMVPIESGTSKCDLTLIAMDSSDPGIAFNYDSDLFAPARIKRMIGHFRNLLEGIADDAGRSVWDLPLLDDAERRRVIEDNRTQTDYPREETLAGLFERQARRRGGEIAVMCGPEKIGYDELNSRANCLARELIELGVSAESRVGISMDRSIEMMVAILGVLKAGGAYVPIDPGYPHDRLHFMIHDASPAVLITQQKFLGGLPVTDAAVVCLDRDWPRIAARGSENPPPASSAENLAYIIYTSGSTGRPKGAAVSQRSMVRLVSNTSYIRFTGDETVAQTANASFDPATFEMWGALLHGGRLVIIPNDVLLDAERLAVELRRNPVDVMFLATALFHELAKQNPALFAPVKQLLFAGEAALPGVVADVLQYGAPGRLINAYGPAECTAFSTAHVVSEIPAGAAGVPIGPPVSNTRIYVLDAKMNLLPRGVAGELYIGGEGVARGYWRRPDLTAEKFLPDPFSDMPGLRIYKSGDRVRCNMAGDLEFLGRADDQVKIRGFRVEPGEIEATLQQHAGVRASAVVAKTGPHEGLRLIAYVVGDASGEELSEYLKSRLPEYMVPAIFMGLAELPLNANGKVDRAALPEPEARARGYRAPRNPQEEMLCEIFAQVLEAGRVGIDDDFFSLGGHSLLATRLVSRIRNTIGAEIELRRVFESPTPAGLALCLPRAGPARAPLVRRSRPANLPVSFAQRRLWLIDQIDKNSAGYNMPEDLLLRGPLDIAALRRSVQIIVDRHESLRTHFAQLEGEPMQVIVQDMNAEVPLEDLRGLASEQRQQRVRAAMAEEWAVPFDLAVGPVFRLKLLRLADEEHVLLRTFHHIVYDGWSQGVFTREFMVLYEALMQGRDNPLPPLEIQYADYALWQREYLNDDGLRKELEYWKTQLAEIPAHLDLGADLPRPAVQTFAADSSVVVIDAELLASLKQLGQSHHATLYMTLLAGFTLLLQRYSGQPDIVVGSPIANRRDERLEHLIGFFVNTLVLRARVDPDLSFAELLGAIRETALEAYRHQDLPFERLVEELSPERRLDRTPVFQVMFALQNAPAGPQQLRGLEIETIGSDELRVRFDLEVHAFERAGRLEVYWIYNRDLFTAGRMDQIAAHFRRLLSAAAAAPAVPVAELEILTEHERKELIFHRNCTDIAFPSCCLHESFERQAAKTPENTAVVFGKDSLSYRELNRRANRLAHHLRAIGVTREIPVGLYIERSLEMMVAVLGILKAGGAFVPLAADLPPARRNAMIFGAGLRYLVTIDAERVEFSGSIEHVVTLDGGAAEMARHSDADLAIVQSPDCIAYISYTSGSTGAPKGVLVPHAAILRLVAAPQWTRLDDSVRMLQSTPLSFDPSMFEIWGALLHGGALILMTPGRVSALEIGDVIRDAQVNSAWLTSGLFREVVDYAAEYLNGMRRLAAGGDVVSVEQVGRMLALHPQCQMINGYGPTENGILTTCYSVPAGAAGSERIARGVPIGFPVSDTRVYVLDERLSPVPVGVPGELYTSGAGLARGYVNRPDLTAERFIPNPHALRPGERMYRTGDLVRWGGDGALEFIGRNDSQVKIRGFRIELTEIEAVLRRHASVREALVVVREQAGERHLFGYVVANPGSANENENEDGATASDPPANTPAEDVEIPTLARTLRLYLKQHLPAYMVPDAILVLSAWPLTSNGKIDRRALPLPTRHIETYRAPRTPQEGILCDIFAEVLGLERVGINDNFFDLGGHSLLATRLVSRVRALLGVDVTLRTLFESPNVVQLAPRLDHGLASFAKPPLSPQARPDRLPASYAQQRLWFIHKLDGGGGTEYNVCEALRLIGPLDIAALRRAVAGIVERHEILRTHFAEAEGAPVQIIEPFRDVPMETVDLSALPDSEIVRDARLDEAMRVERETPFDLENGPMLRMKLLKMNAREYVLLRTFHHIVSDAWSHGIFGSELMALYDAFQRGAENPLPPLTVQYADFALWQSRWLTDEVLDAHMAYWKKELADIPAQLALPQDFPRPAAQVFAADTCVAVLPEKTVTALRQFGSDRQSTLYMTLMAAFAVLLRRYCGENDIVVGSPIANRQDAQLEKLIGLFVNSLVVRIRVSPDENFRQLLSQARNTILESYAHQDTPFERLVEGLSPRRSLNVTPIFQVLFALQNAPRGPQRLRDLVVEPLAADGHISRVDLEVHAFEREGAMVFYWLYKRDLFAPWRMEQMACHYTQLLQSLAFSPETPLGRIEILSAQEKHQALVEWNRTHTVFDHRQTVVDLFEEHVKATPRAPALSCGGETLTYVELDRRSTRLARYLRGLGAGPEVRIGARMERGPEIVIALLAILKVGATWVPVDPDFPAERAAWLLRDTQARFVVTTSGLRSHLPPEIPVVELDSAQGKIAAESFGPLRSDICPETAAYVIYTSGSTGTPRGVVISHLNLRNMAEAQRRAFAPECADRIVQFFSFSFDVSMLSTLMALTSGACLVPGTKEQLMPGADLQTLLESEKITIGVLPPVVLDHLHADRLPHLRTIIVGGEPWSEDLLKIWGPGRRFFNSYGPTETTVQAAAGECRFGEGRPSIGRPIANARIYLPDDDGAPAPVGVPAELCIAGDGVGRGYLDAALTAEKFVPDAFSGIPGERLYRTGDWARRLPDGRIDLQGRKDGQVKIRGYRVEIGEVESVLARHPSVLQCAVMARQKGNGTSGEEKRLVAYVVAVPGQTADVDVLREFLKAKLPEYMVPAQFVPLPHLPLNSSGKVDRHKLPEAEFTAADSGRTANSAEEEILCQVFADILGLEKAGLDDNFFDLGGHSLLATRLVSRVRTVMGVELPLRAVFEAPTVGRLVAHLQGAAKSARPLTRQPRPDRIPLSWSQRRLWFIDQLRGGSPEYNMPEASRLRGPVSYEAMRRALESLVRRHEVLRTRFAEVEGDPVQIVDPPGSVTLVIDDLTGLSDEAQRARIDAAIAEEVYNPFDLSRGPLLRMKLLRLKDGEHVLLRNMHHIVTDGWSQGILNREFMALYEAFLEGRSDPEASLDPLPLQYADYALWQREHAEADLQSQMQYWKAHLAGIPEELVLPKDRPRPPRQTFTGDICIERMPVDDVRALTRLGRSSQTTVFMTILSAFAALLQRYSGQTDIVIGSPIANRRDEQLEKLMGFFVNSLVMRVRVRPEETFRDLLHEVRTVALDAYRHQDLPFERLVEELSPERSLNRPPICQVTFILQNAPLGTQTLKGLTVEPEPGEGIHTHYDLQLEAIEQSGEILFHWMYNRDLFDSWRMERMARHFMRLMRAAVAFPETPVYALPLLSEDERAQILTEWNDTARAYPAGQSVMWQVARQAARTPSATALVCGEESVTYADLDARSNRLARYLRELGVGPEVGVGVCAARGPQLLIAMLATFRAGGVYVPLDPAYPMERLNYMLDDSGARVLVTQPSLLSRFSAFQGTVVSLDDRRDEVTACSAESLPEITYPANLAFVIYTSGSTGRPKGVGICRGSLDALLHWLLEIFSPEELRGVLFSTSVCFDISLFEIFAPLSCGGTVHIVENILELSPAHSQKITLLNGVPSAIGELERMKLIPPSVRTVVFGGEALGRSLVSSIYAGTAARRVINLYGPSEDTLCSTWIPLPRESDAVPPIGRPKANTQAWVLDAWLQPVPVGVAGELYLGGAGQARGYLGRPELTAERFVPDPFTPAPGGRLYRTGDLVRWSPQGALDFLGRADDQVKIHGFRIELGEIESVLREFPGIDQVVVTASEDDVGEKRLCAYIVTADRGEGSVDALRDYLKGRLPRHMVPAHFIFIERFPLMPNGKVDRRALPRPQAASVGLYVAPGTEMEKLVADVWRQALDVERVGLDDNFFDLGGHSLLVARVRFALRGRLQRSIAMVDLFTFPTVRGLALHLQREESEGAAEKESAIALDSQDRAARQRAAMLRRRNPEAAKRELP